jgi:hypothetical protein
MLPEFACERLFARLVQDESVVKLEGAPALESGPKMPFGARVVKELGLR